MFQTRMGRQVFGGVLVLLLSVGTVLALRGAHKPYSPEAPAYRQKGDPEARIVMAEFSDFQCPGCAAATQTVKGLLSVYGKDVRLTFKHFPLERMHPKARHAARAAECAGRQGRFWELHDILFEKQHDWSHGDLDALLPAYAKQAGADFAAMASCMADPAVDLAITADVAEGDQRWVGSTPTFFINGRRFAGGRQLSTLGTTWIDKQLKNR